MKKLVKKIKYTATIELLSGLHIGGTNIAMAIGGPDKFVVRNPIDQKPYIPGSSLKGKMRSLLELALGEYEIARNGNGAKPCADSNKICGHLFGTAAAGEGAQPSRVIVRDALMKTEPDELTNTDLYLTEAKTEVSIDRITAKANPRTNERVPKGVCFKFEAILNIFSDDNEKELRRNFEKAVHLLEDDYIGGNGSRGYGQIAFRDWNNGEEKLVENY